MKYIAELKTNFKISQGRNISASVVAEMEKKSDIQLSSMYDMLEEMVSGYAPVEPMAIETKIKPQSKNKMVSPKQIGLIRFLLMSANVPEHELCKQYSIHRLNELTMADARDAIQDLKTRNMFD